METEELALVLETLKRIENKLSDLDSKIENIEAIKVL